MKAIEMTAEEAGFISEMLVLFRKLTRKQQEKVLVELAQRLNNIALS